MKENKKLDKQFRDGLKDLEVGPPDGTRSDIENRLLEAGLLKEKNDGRGGLWMFVLLALLVAAPLIFLLKKNQKQSKALAGQAMVKDSGNAFASDLKSNAVVSMDNEKISVRENKKDMKQMAVAGKARVSEKSNLKKEKNKQGQSSVLSAADKKRKRGERGTKKSDATDLPAERILFQKNNAAAGSVVHAGDLKETEKEKDKTESAANSNQPAEASEIITPVMENDLAAETLQSADSAGKDTLAMVRSNPAKDTTNKQLPQKEKNEKRAAVDFSGAPQFNSIKYGNGSGQFRDYIYESRQSEKETPSFCAAFGIVITLNQVILETGLRHSVLSSNFSYTQNYTTTDTSQSHADISGQWIHVETIVHGQTHYIATNKIAFLEFPLLTGYNFHVNKFEAEIKSGVLMSFIKSANTTIFSLNSGEAVKYDELSNSPYRKTCWSFLGAVNMLYPIGDRILVFIQPSVKYGLSSIFRKDYPVTKKIQSYNGAIGVRVRL